MKKTLLICTLLISLFASAQLPAVPGFTNINQKYQWYQGIFYQRLSPPSDTTTVKTGIALISSSFYVGNGSWWTAVSGGAGGVSQAALNDTAANIRADFKLAHQTLTYSTTTTWDLSIGQVADLTVTGSTTIAFSNVDGPFVAVLYVTQGGSGSYTVTFPSGTYIPGTYALSTTVGAMDQITIVYDGFKYGLSINNAYAVAPIPPSFVTWNSINASLEQYNTNEGIRKKASAGAGWNNSAYSNETVGPGESVTVRIGNTSKARQIGLNPTRGGSGSSGQWTFSLYVRNDNTFDLNDASGNVTVGGSYSVGDLLRLRNTGSSLIYEQSTNSGVSWSTLATAATTPSGNYFVCVEIYDISGGFDEVFK